MAMNFADAPTEQGGEIVLIPDGTLAFATVNVRPKAIDMGVVSIKGKDNPDNRYLDLMIELTSGPSVGRKIFHKLGVAGSEKWVNMSMAAIRHILEVGNGAGPGNPGGYMLGVKLADGDDRMWMELDGMQCAIKVGIEPAKGDFKAKNSIRSFLSPNPDSPTAKDFAALQSGATMAAGSPAPAGTNPAVNQNAWERPAGTSAPGGVTPPATAPANRPTWAGAPPPANNAGGKIPF